MKFIRRNWKYATTAVLTVLLLRFCGTPEAGAINPPRPTVVAPNPYGTPCVKDVTACGQFSILAALPWDQATLLSKGIVDVVVFADDKYAVTTAVIMLCSNFSPQLVRSTSVRKLRDGAAALDWRIHQVMFIDPKIGTPGAALILDHGAIPNTEVVPLGTKLVRLVLAHRACAIPKT